MLRREGWQANHKRVLRIMRTDNLLSLRKKGFKPPTTDSKHSWRVWPNLVRGMQTTALNQLWVLQAPVSIVVAADFRRTTNRYGQRGIRYVFMEVGHAAENLHLQAESLGLASVAIGAYRDDEAAAILDIGPPLEILYIISVGKGEG